MPGITIAEELHVVNILPPVDLNGSAKNSDVFDMENYAHATIIIQAGVTGAAFTVTVEECDDFVPTTVTAIAYAVYKEETDAGDTLGVRTAVAAAGFAASLNNNIMYVIEIDARQLTDGRAKLRVAFTDPAAATVASAVAILSGSRYAQDQSPTAIA